MELSIVWKEGSCIIFIVMRLIGDYTIFSMGLAEMIIYADNLIMFLEVVKTVDRIVIMNTGA